MSETSSVPPDASNAANRRASSRVRKQPEHYTSSPFSSAVKRKRDEGEGADVDGDADMADLEDEDESEEDDDPEDEPAEEEVREARAKKARQPKKPAAPKKQPPQKKPKTNGVSLPIRGAAKAKAPARKRPPKKLPAKAIDREDAESAGGVYAQLFAQNKDIAEIVADWLRAFGEHESQALRDIINFVLKCAGTSGQVTEFDIEDPDGASNRLTDLQDEYQATNPTDYPLVTKGKSTAAFKATITHFIHTIVKAVAASGLLTSNPELMENIQVWLSTMSSATSRPFRHTATVLALSVCTALCEVARDLAEKAATTLRQAESEKKKARPNKERVKQIEAKAKEASSDLEIVEAMLKDWFDTVFIHRYRDRDPLIRRDCIEALGDWIVTMPDHFFDGQHLRYLGWLLSDQSATTRLEVLKQLHRFYSDSDKLSGLKTFTERFRPRLVEMGTSDSDISVRISGIELLDKLRQNDLLEPDDIDAIGKLVFHEDAKVRTAVAAFFSENVNDLYTAKIDELGGAESLAENLPEVSEGNFEAPQLSWLKYKSLAETLSSYDQEDPGSSQFQRNRSDGSLILNVTGTDSMFTLAVESLYDKIEDLKDWQALAGYLLFDHTGGRANGVGEDPLSQLKHEATLTEKVELILLEVLHASVKRSFSDLAEEHVAHKGKLTKKQKEDLQEELEDSVRNLTDLIPKLLKKFGDTPSTAAAVLRLEGMFALPSLQSLRQDPTVNNALLDDLRKQFMSHSTDEVLGPATAAILHAKSYGELDESAHEKMSSLWDDVIGNLAELLNIQTVTVRGASPQEELVALSNNLLRIVRLARIADPVPALEDGSVKASDKKSGKKYNGAIDFIIDLLQRAVHSSGPPPEPEEAALEDLVAARAAEAGLLYLQWKISRIMNATKSNGTAELSMDNLEPLAERRDLYSENILKVLDGRKANEQVCCSMAGCLLDLYRSAAILNTARPKPGISEDYTALVVSFDDVHEKAILKVFATLERDFAKISGKSLEKRVTEKDSDDEMDVEADPIDDDPISDPENEDEETQGQTQASQQARDSKLAKTLFAEQRLCFLTAKIVQAITADVINNKDLRKRLERNKTKLGPNFKEVLQYLDVKEKGVPKGKGRPKAKAPTGAAAKKGGKPNPKSNAIVAEDELEDEIEDDDDAEDVRRRGLNVDGDEEREPEDDQDQDQEMVNGDNQPEEEDDGLGD